MAEKRERQLHPRAIELLEASNVRRIAYIHEDKWIGYPRALEAMRKLEDLLAMPRKLRMPNMLLVGHTNNGKSSIIERFIDRHGAVDGSEAYSRVIINVMAPDGPDLSKLYGDILYEMMVPYNATAKKGKKEELVRHYFEQTGVRMLVIDEIHNILSGTISNQKAFMNALKNLSNKLCIPIVLVGIKDALNATGTDEQISNRFTPFFLPQWKIDENYVALLASIETFLPLRKASSLGMEKRVAMEIYNLTEGYIGEVISLVNAAAVYAIESGSEKITMKELRECGYMDSLKRRTLTAEL
jgi:hypothetical protein